MATPTKDEIKTALRVLRHYEKIAAKVSLETEQERPFEWTRGADVWIELLRSGDPEEVMLDYLAEYKAGHED